MAVRDATRALRSSTLHSTVTKGVVQSVREDYDNPAKVYVTVRSPSVKRKSTKGPQAEPYRPSQDVCVPASLGLTVGDRVSISTTLERRA